MKKNKLLLLTIAAGLATLVTGCNHQDSKHKGISGSGSTFIYPVMSQWSNAYYKRSKIAVNYLAIGSGGGQRQIFKKIVDFAASDQPLSDEKLQQYHLIQFPAIVGGIVPVIHLANIKSNQLTLNGKILAHIYLGKIIYWDETPIKQLNPELSLPHKKIISIHRSDGSGTTYNFSKYLSDLSSTWKENVGVGTALQWPTGIGAKGNQGVAVQIEQTDSSIGYVEYTYAKQNNITTVKMINQTGNPAIPNLNSFQSAAQHAAWEASKNYRMVLVNQPGESSWPIVATTFILLPKESNESIKEKIKSFFTFVYSKEGETIAKKLDYVGIPKNVVNGIKTYWAQEKE